MTLNKREWGRRYWLHHIYRRPLQLRDTAPIVSFTFDDFPRTAYTVGGAMLKSYGARGTFYSAFGLMNSANDSGHLFQLDDLHSLIADQHELGSHTFNHVSSRCTSGNMFLQDALEGRAALQRVPGLTVSDNFAYPFGAVTAHSKRVVGNSMLSCRSIYRGVNAPLVDLNLLLANPLYGDTDQLGFLRRLFHEAQQLGGWLILYTHDVREAHSRYGCTPALLDSAIRLARDSSMQILTVNEVVRTRLKSAVNTQRRSAYL